MTQPKSIELFLFFNPFGKLCLESEKHILSFSKERSENVSIRFIPFVNFRLINQRNKDTEFFIPFPDNDYNASFDMSYRLSIAFIAATMQGKKKGINFILKLQKSMNETRSKPSMSLILKVAKDSSLEIEEFMEDFYSDLAKRIFFKNQRLAQEMKIESTPTCVLYQYCNGSPAMLIQSRINKNTLHSLCNHESQRAKLRRMIQN